MTQETAPHGAIFAFGGFTLNPRKRRVLKGDVVVPLTTKAFDTLEALVRSAGRTVSKEELLKHVWPDTFVQEDTLAQNVSTIRKALGDSPESPQFILTVPREGYRFVAPVEVVRPPPVVEPLPKTDAHALPRPAGTNRPRHWRFYFAAGAATGVLLATIGFFLWGRPHLRSPATPTRLATTFELFEPEGARFSTSGGVLAMSPDGRHLAFLASDADGTDHLWIRALDSLESRQLPGTLDASQPFWSADSQSIAFFSGGSLRRVDISGGLSRAVCQLPGPEALAGSWNDQNLIVFPVGGKGLFQVPATGGTATHVTVSGMGLCSDCLWPSFLPDGRRFLFTVMSATPDGGIYVGSLDGGTPVRVLETASSSAYTSAGYLLYASEGALVARRFDPVHARASGDVVPIADRVWFNLGTRRAVFSVSNTGLIAYREPLTTRLQWISRSGAVISTGPEAVYHSFVVSRDGRVVASQLDPRVGTYDLWLHDAGWTASSRLTFDPASDVRPVWSDDGSKTVFARQAGNGWQLYEVSIDRPGAERPLLPEPSRKPVEAVRWNGDVLEYATLGLSGPSHVWAVRPGRGDGPTSIHEGDPNGGVKSVSPDGKWLAYTINVADSRVPHTAVFVRSWRGTPGQSEIAAAGSVPRWRSDNHELFFIAPGGRLMAQRVDEGRAVGAPVQLCTTEALATSGLAGQAYDAAPDGQRFLVKVPARRASIIVMSGWLGERQDAQLN